MVSYTKHTDIEVFQGEISKHQYPWHFHKCYTLILVEKGSIIYEFNDEQLKVEPAEVLIIEPFKTHRNTITRTTVYKAIFIPQKYFESVGQDKYFTVKVNHSEVVAKIADMLKHTALNYNRGGFKKNIVELCQLIYHSQSAQIHISSSAINTIPEIDYDLSVKELAQKAHLSKFHFQRKFKKKCGLTIGQLKQQEKTTKAKALLENGKLSTDVAHQLGFFDQSHFIKYFKKMWAITPKNFK